MPTQFINNEFTGLVGFQARFENLGGDSLPFRIEKVYSYQVTSSGDFRAGESEYINSKLKEFIEKYSGKFTEDIFVSSTSFSNSSDTLNDHVRFATVNYEVKEYELFDSYNNQDYTNIKNTGLADISKYFNVIKSYSDSISVGIGENKEKDISHNVSVSLLTGAYDGGDIFIADDAKSLATQIAQAIFNQSKNIDGFSYYETGMMDEDQYTNYYSESYDHINFSYTFGKTSKKLAEANKEFTSSLSMSEDGTVSVTIKNLFKANKYYSEIENLATDSMLNEAIDVYTGFLSNGFSTGVSRDSQYIQSGSGLYLTSYSRSMNKLANTIEIQADYSDDPNYFKEVGFLKSENVEISMDEKNVISANYSVDYQSQLPKSIDGASQAGIVSKIQSDINNSESKISSIISSNKLSSPYFDNNLVRLSKSVEIPQRGKQYTASVSYSTDYSYNSGSSAIFCELVGDLKQLSVTKSSSESIRKIIEYKIVNPASQNNLTLLNYPGQYNQGSYEFSVKGVLPRSTQNIMEDPGAIQSSVKSILDKFIKSGKNSFLNDSFASFAGANANYYLSEIRCGVDSDYNIDANLSFVYTIDQPNRPLNL